MGKYIQSAADLDFFLTVPLEEATFEEATALAHDIDTSAKTLRIALRAVRGNAALCADAIHFRRVANLPDAALDQLVIITKQIISNLELTNPKPP